jgi:hypothetical protein
VAETLGLGPNGGLVFCMDYLVEQSQWLLDKLAEYGEDEYLLFDMPGQTELFAHSTVARDIISMLDSASVRVCAVYLLDASFVADASRFISGALMALCTMVSLETPHVNVSKTGCSCFASPPYA